MSDYTMEVIDIGEPFGVEAYAAQGFYMHRYPEQPVETNWQVRSGLSNVLLRRVSWCEAKDEFWRNTGVDLGNAWGNCSQAARVAALPAFVEAPLQHATSGTHFASFDDKPITAKLFQENTPMCATREEAIRTDCDCQWHRDNWQTEPQPDYFARAMGGLALVAAIAAALATLVALLGVFILTWAAVAGTLALTWALRRQLLAVARLTTWPVRASVGVIRTGFAMLEQERQAAAMPTIMLTGATTYKVVEPALLTDNLQPIAVEFPTRHGAKVKVQ